MRLSVVHKHSTGKRFVRADWNFSRRTQWFLTAGTNKNGSPVRQGKNWSNLGADTRKSHYTSWVSSHLASLVPDRQENCVLNRKISQRHLYTGEEEQKWVPPAYRGTARSQRLVPRNEDRATKISPRHRARPSKGVPIRTKTRIQPSKPTRQPRGKAKPTSAAASAERRQRREDQLREQCCKLEQLAYAYKLVLMSSPDQINSKPNIASLQSSTKDTSLEEHKNHLSEILLSLHYADSHGEESLVETEKQDQSLDNGSDNGNDNGLFLQLDSKDQPPGEETTPNEDQSQLVEEDIFQLRSSENENQRESGTVKAPLRVETWEHIKETEHLFNDICHLLRDIVITSSSLLGWERDSDNESVSNTAIIADTFSLLDLSLVGLRALKQIRRDREMLVESTKPPEKTPDPSITEEKSWIGSVQTMVTSLLLGQQESHSKDDEKQSEFLSTHDNPALEATIELHQDVLRPMLFALANILPSTTVHSTTQVKETDDTHIPPVTYRRASQYVVTILQLISEQDENFESIDAIQTQKVLQFLCSGGTLESAQWSNRLLKSMSGSSASLLVKQGVHEITVWRSYVEAAKNGDASMTERKEAARQLFHIWLDRWNNNFPASIVERLEQASTVLYAIAAVGYGEEKAVDDQLQRAAETVAFRFLGRDGYGKIRENFKSGTTVLKSLKNKDFPFIDALARVYACCDLPKAQLLIETLIAAQGEQYPAVDTVDRYVEGLQFHYDKVGPKDSDRNSVSDAEFAMSMLNDMMSRRETTGLPSQETFAKISRLLTILSPPHVGQYFLTWISHFELRRHMDGPDVIIGPADYNRVLWSFWQEAKTQNPDGPDQFSCCERGWELLVKMDFLSMPLLMSGREVRLSQQSRSNPLYAVDNQPTKRSYEILLNICADTRVKSKFETVGEILLKILALAERNKMELSPAVVDRCVVACISKLDRESSLARSLASHAPTSEEVSAA